MVVVGLGYDFLFKSLLGHCGSKFLAKNKHTIFPQIASMKSIFLNLEIVENSNSCCKFQFLRNKQTFFAFFVQTFIHFWIPSLETSQPALPYC